MKLTGKLLGIVVLGVIRAAGSCARNKHYLGEDQGGCEDQLVDWEKWIELEIFRVMIMCMKRKLTGKLLERSHQIFALKSSV